MEEQEQDGADVHRRGWRGDDWPDVRLRAAVPPLLPSELLLPAVCQRPRLLAHLTVCPLSARQASGLGGAAVAGHDTEQVETMEPVKGRVLKISFNADTHASMQWNFRPQQSEIFVMMIRLLWFCPPNLDPPRTEPVCLCPPCPRWSRVRRRWRSTEQRTPPTNPSLASPPTTWCPSMRASTSTRSRCLEPGPKADPGSLD